MGHEEMVRGDASDDLRRMAAAAQQKAAYMSSSFFEELRTPAVRDLEALNEEHLTIRAEHEAEIKDLQQTFDKKYQALLERRRALLTAAAVHADGEGDAAAGSMPTASSGTAACKSSSSGRKPATGRAAPSSGTPALPGFWRIALQNADEFQEDIQPHDELVLDYLRDIRIADLDSSRDSGFQIWFIFEPNPFFSNTVLEKVYHTERRSHYMDANYIRVCAITSSKIDWYPGQNVTVDTVAKKARGGRRRLTKSRKEEVPRPSFFRTCFRRLGPHEEIPEEELADSEEEEDGQFMDYLMHNDYEQALFLRHVLIPHAVRWYTGEACSDNEKPGDDRSSDSSDEEEEDEAEDTERQTDRRVPSSKKNDYHMRVEFAKMGRPSRYP